MWKIVFILLVFVLFNANYAQADDDCVKYSQIEKQSLQGCKDAAKQLNFTAKKLAQCADVKNPHKSCEADFEWVKKAYDSYKTSNHEFMKAREKIEKNCK